MHIEYRDGKPRDCKHCYFHDGLVCTLKDCYYEIQVPPKPPSECDGCPYGRHQPCIGWCTKELLKSIGREY